MSVGGGVPSVWRAWIGSRPMASASSTPSGPPRPGARRPARPAGVRRRAGPICASSGATSGVVLVTLALPDRRNMMSAAMTASWGGAMAGLRADPSVRARGRHRRGQRVLLRRRLSWIGAEPDATVDELREPNAAVLPDLAGDPGPRGADDRRDQRGRRRRRALRWRWPATCATRPRTPSWPCRSPQLGMHAGMATT